MYTVDRHNPTPLYEQIKLILRDEIVSGALKPGVQLPTESALCKKYEVSRITIVKALDELAHDGLIHRIQGKGSIVNELPIKSNMNEVMGFNATMRQIGIEPRSKVVSIETIDDDLNLRRKFRLPLNVVHRFIRFKRLMFINDMPSIVFDVHVRQELGLKMQEYDLDNISFYKLYQEILGRPVTRNETSLSPILANAEAIELLKVKPGTAHFLFQGLSFLEGDIPVELAIGIHRGDLFQFESTIYRVREEVAHTVIR